MHNFLKNDEVRPSRVEGCGKVWVTPKLEVMSIEEVQTNVAGASADGTNGASATNTNS